MAALLGVGIFIISLVVFGYILPRNGKPHRIVGTQFEPYAAIAVVGSAAFGLGLVVVWIVDWAV